MTEKPGMWKLVEQSTADGTLEALRDGKLATSSSGDGRKPAPDEPGSRREGNNSRAASTFSKIAALQVQDEESDGGFFEE